MDELTHIDKNGNAVMVDVSDKAETDRFAKASGLIRMNDTAITAVSNGEVK